jgi:hypothetical protein
MPNTVVVSFRQAPSGGDIDIAQATQQAQALQGLPHLIILLHGYNNDQHDAITAYGAFDKRQQSTLQPGGDWAPGATVVRVFWPGDARWWIASPLYYPWAIPRALTIGKALGAIISDLGKNADTLVVDFVGHSLGNRVLLHTISALDGQPSVWIRRVVHMAGAVPTWTLESTARIEPLRAALQRECATDSAATSLFSEYDDVLALAFPPGETAANTYDGEVPVALGHGTWSDGQQPTNLSQLRATGAGHSNYWGAEIKSKSLDDWIRDTVNTSLALGNSSARPTPLAIQSERTAGDSRTLSSRTTGSRDVGPSD